MRGGLSKLHYLDCSIGELKCSYVREELKATLLSDDSQPPTLLSGNSRSPNQRRDRLATRYVIVADYAAIETKVTAATAHIHTDCELVF